MNINLADCNNKGGTLTCFAIGKSKEQKMNKEAPALAFYFVYFFGLSGSHGHNYSLQQVGGEISP